MQFRRVMSSSLVLFAVSLVLCGCGGDILRAARNEVLARRWFFGMMGVGV